MSDDKSKQYAVINIRKGLYQYNRLCFGISLSPAIFQEVMDKILEGIPGTSWYLDDVTVTEKDDTQHLLNL